MKTRLTKARMTHQICAMGLMVCLWLGGVSSGFGQTLGGLPNPNFNPGDTGATSLIPMFYKQPFQMDGSSFFRPSFNGGVVFLSDEVGSSPSYPGPKSFNHANRDGEMLTKENEKGITSFAGFLASKAFSINPNFHIFNLIKYNNDSLFFVAVENKNGIVTRRKFFSKKLEPNSSTFGSFCKFEGNKYLISYCIFSTPIPKIRYEFLDSTFKPTGVFKEFEYSNGFSPLSPNITINSFGSNIVSAFDKNDTIVLSKFDSNFNIVFEKKIIDHYYFGSEYEVKDHRTIKLLPDNKILLYWLGKSDYDTIVRFMPNGDVDQGFSVNFPVGSRGIKFDYAVDGKLRVGWVQDIGNIRKCFWAEVNQNGGLENIVTGVLESYIKPDRALMYHPELHAFLFETEIIWSYGGTGDYRFRFYILGTGLSEPLVKANGCHPSPYYWQGNFGDFKTSAPTFTLNKRLKKIVFNSWQLYGYYGKPIQYNGILSPDFIVLDQDGGFTSGFKSSMTFPRSLRDSVSNGLPSMYVVGGKKILRGQGSSRYNLDGSRDNSFVKFKTNGKLFELQNGNFVALDSDSQRLNNLPSGNIRVVEIDSLGNFIGIKKTLPIDPTWDLPGENLIRNFHILGEDKMGGIWLRFYIIGNQIGQKGYFLRLDTSGSIVRISFSHFMADIDFDESFSSIGGAAQYFFDALPNGNFQIWTAGSGPNTKFIFSPDGQFISKAAGLNLNSNLFGNYFSKVSISHRQRDGKFLATISLPQAPKDKNKYMARFFQDGRLDPSFVPFIYFGDVNESFILGDQFISTLSVPDSCGPLRKSGFYAFHLNSGAENSGFVQGKVELVPGDLTGCSPAGPRTPGYLSLLSSSPGNSLAFSNKSGFYSFALNPGNYTIKQDNANLQFKNQLCPEPVTPNHLVNLSSSGQVELNKNFINGVYACAKLNVSILQPRFRLCSKSSFTIQYQNSGILAEPNARILVSMPKPVKILSASSPFTIRPDSSYVFDVGNLIPGQTGSILVLDTVGCGSTPDSNARACFSVRMEPLSVCSQLITTGWNGAWLDGKAKYIPATGLVRFVIINRGQNQTDSTSLRFINGGFVPIRMVKLSAGDSSVLLIPSSLWGTSIVVEQPANCPYANIGEIRHSGTSTANFYMSFYGGWLANQTVTACPNFRYSYDPNEKIVEPVDPVLPGKELNYTIHFENLGNDTAYVVYIADTLPEGVDIRSFRMVGSSHPCEAMVGGTLEKPVLAFNFMPIRLPGKKQNPILSKGQVDFKISLRDNVALGSQHRNRAHIYFDRNEPIITNTVMTKVIDPNNTTAVEALKTESRLLVYPNPNKGSFTVSLPKGFGKNRIVVGDIQGRVIKEFKADEKGENAISGLQSGLYLIYVEGLKPVKVMVD